MMRRGRPGLIGTVARTAVVAGTATAVSKGVSNKMNASAEAKQEAAAQDQQQQQQIDQLQQQQDQIAAQQQPAVAATPAADDDDLVEQLQKLSSLKESGALSDEEFAAAKAKLIGA